MSGIANLKKIALDSNLFIYHFEDNAAFAPYTNKIFTSLCQGRLKAVTSTVSIIETLSYPSPPKVIRSIAEAFLNIPNLEIIEVNQHVALEAARIRRKYGFRLPDSVQLATATLNKAEAFISNDQRLKRFQQCKIVLLHEV